MTLFVIGKWTNMDIPELIESIVQLAKEVDKEDSTDFGYLQVDEDTAYRTIALELVERNYSVDKDYRNLMLLATCTHLVVENLVLNAQLLERNRNA